MDDKDDRPLFVKGQTYPFEFCGFQHYNGEKGWFILKSVDLGSCTIPGYERDRWVFRVRPRPFQNDWDEDDAKAWGVFWCEVVGFNLDAYTQEETGFPILRQSNKHIQAKFYSESDFDTAREFRVVKVPGDVNDNGKTATAFILEDVKNHLTIPVPAKVFCDKTPERDAVVELHVFADESTGLRVATRDEFAKDKTNRKLLEAIPQAFEEGGEYDAKVVDIDTMNADYVIVRTSAMPELECRVRRRRDLPLKFGDSISVRCVGFKDSGYPRLVVASADSVLPADELEMLDLPTRQESLRVEFKSSLVYPITGDGAPDIDKQLGWEIAHVAASFMNTDGGSIFVGVSDDGSVCGIENELRYLNAAGKSGRHYSPTYGGLKDKIVDVLAMRLGKGGAALLGEIRFFRCGGHVVCEIPVKQNLSPTPVLFDEGRLFVRFPGSTRELLGADLVLYVQNRSRQTSRQKNSRTAASKEPVPIHSLPDSFVVIPAKSPANADSDPKMVGRYIDLFRNGEASKFTNPPTKPLPAPENDCICRIPIADGMFNTKSRLLLCYEWGLVNVLVPKEVWEEKLTIFNRRYRNGFDTVAGHAPLMAAAVCDMADILVMRTWHEHEGQGYVKAVPICQYSSHAPGAMNTIGNDCCGIRKYWPKSRVIDYWLLPERLSGYFPWLRPRKGQGAGKAMADDDPRWKALHPYLVPLGLSTTGVPCQAPTVDAPPQFDFEAKEARKNRRNSSFDDLVADYRENAGEVIDDAGLEREGLLARSIKEIEKQASSKKAPIQCKGIGLRENGKYRLFRLETFAEALRLVATKMFLGHGDAMLAAAKMDREERKKLGLTGLAMSLEKMGRKPGTRVVKLGEDGSGPLVNLKLDDKYIARFIGNLVCIDKAHAKEDVVFFQSAS